MRFIDRALRLLCACLSVVTATAAAPSPEILPTELEALLGPLFEQELERRRVPGGVIVVFGRDGVLWARGYGYADVDTGRPVDPASTPFYLGSVTKMFTAAAVLQQVDQGRLDLHRDVRDYLASVALDSSFSEPVTLQYLLTHTSGLDDRNIGYVARTKETASPLGEHLARSLPPIVRRPGGISSYSNYGYGLAGHLVERTAGRPYADYVDERILRPLNMTASTAHCPPRGSLAARAAVPYDFDPRTGKLELRPLGYRNLPPAGTVSASASDMARFLRMLLRGGELDGVRVLNEDTVARMLSRQFSHHPRLPGFGYGFYERRRTGVRVLEHGGSFLGATALVVLLPDEGIGLFTAGNRAATAPHYIVLQRFLDRYWPEAAAAVEPATPESLPAPDAAELVGTYQWTRYGKSNVEKLAILDSQLALETAPPNRLVLEPRRGQASEWVPLEADLYRRAGGLDLLAVGRGDTGRVTHLYVSQENGLPVALERLTWNDSLGFNLAWMMVSLVMFASAFTLWPLACTVRGRFRRARNLPPPESVGSVAGGWVCGLQGFLGVALLLGLSELLGNSGYRLGLIFGMSAEMKVLLWIPLLMMPLTLALGAWAIRAWVRRRGSLAARLYYTMLAVVSVGLYAFLLNWNLLGFRY